MANNVSTDVNTYPTGGILTHQVMATYDVFKPQHAAEIFARYGNQFFPFFLWLKSMGREMPIAGESWFGHEENRYHRAFQVRNQVTNPGANQPAWITLKATDLDSNYKFYPRAGDIVTIPGTEVQARINSIDVTVPSAPVLTVVPQKLGMNIGALAASTTIIITSASFANGTGQPQGTRVGVTKRTFYTQIIKETVGAEGGVLTDEPWYQVTDDNKNFIGWYTPGFNRAEYLQSLKIDGAMFLGQETDNTDVSFIVPAGEDGEGNTPQTMKGIIPWIRDLGWAQPTTGTYDFTDLNEASLYMRQNGVTSGISLWLQGARLNFNVEDAMKDYLKYTGVDFTKVVNQVYGGDEKLAVSINFGVITKGQMTFMQKVMDLWSNPTMYGADGYDYENYGLMIPLTSFKDPVSGAKLNNLTFRYKELNGYSRKMEIWSVAGAGGKQMYVHDIDNTKTFIRSHVGLELFKVNQMIMNDPT